LSRSAAGIKVRIGLHFRLSYASELLSDVIHDVQEELDRGIEGDTEP
jgi:hypothetical protein